MIFDAVVSQGVLGTSLIGAGWFLDALLRGPRVMAVPLHRHENLTTSAGAFETLLSRLRDAERAATRLGRMDETHAAASLAPLFARHAARVAEMGGAALGKDAGSGTLVGRAAATLSAVEATFRAESEAFDALQGRVLSAYDELIMIETEDPIRGELETLKAAMVDAFDTADL